MLGTPGALSTIGTVASPAWLGHALSKRAQYCVHRCSDPQDQLSAVRQPSARRTRQHRCLGSSLHRCRRTKRKEVQKWLQLDSASAWHSTACRAAAGVARMPLSGGNNSGDSSSSSGGGGNGTERSSSPSDMFQSALNALDLFDQPLAGAHHPEDQAEWHEDISVEQNAAASVGRSVYEVLRVNAAGRTRKVYIRRRDLLRGNRLQPRDMRRIDPSLSVTKASPSVTVKESCLLVNLGGVRAIITGQRCLLFEPDSGCSRKFLETVLPRLAASEGERAAAAVVARADAAQEEDVRPLPFELDMLEGALLVATGRLDAELVGVTRRCSRVLQMLPKDITPVNLEELRRVKQQLVELQSKAENIVDMLEELMDDEDELRDMNLSSRPLREEARRQRERDRIERDMERERRDSAGRALESGMEDFTPEVPSRQQRERKRRLAALQQQQQQQQQQPPDVQHAAQLQGAQPGQGLQQGNGHRWEGELSRTYEEAEEGGFAEAEHALYELEVAEAEEAELEEVEDLLEHYLQRAASTQSEAERMLAGSRDLEESIGVSLSARRFEVNRLELLLSIASFAAALGAMIAGIFGMNLRSTLEESVVGFWGTTGLIVLGCFWVFWALYTYTRRRRIL